jgi:hypothetical protein
MAYQKALISDFDATGDRKTTIDKIKDPVIIKRFLDELKGYKP